MTWRVIVGTLSLVFTMILLGYVAVTEQDRMANFGLAYDARQIEAGATLFENNCRVCHGDTGQGVPAKGPPLNVPELFNGTRVKEAAFPGTIPNFVRLTVAAGRPRMSEWAKAQGFIDPMPTWGDNYGGPLRPDQVDGLVAFVMNWGLAFNNGEQATAIPVNAVGTDISVALPAGDAAAGADLAKANGCTACHVDSATGPAWLASAYPSGQGIGTRAAARISEADYTGKATTPEQYLFESIVQPNAFIVPDSPSYATGGQSIMPQDYGSRLSAQDVANIIAYTLSLK